jgi:hypothetical protein
MPNLLFHQNMYNFGGANLARNQHYASVFRNLCFTLPPTVSIKVAGFTEITNNITSVPALSNLADNLMGANSTYVIACGRTAGAVNPEFIGISIAIDTPVIAIGRIFLTLNGGSGVTLKHDPAPVLPLRPEWSNNIPEEATIDFRGVVYVVVTIDGNNVVVGFLHNLYTFEIQRFLVRSKISKMIKELREYYQRITNRNVYVYIGGDFNLSPQRVGNIREGYSYPYYSYRPTTNGGNLYDYWYSHPINFFPQGMVPRAGDYSLTRVVISPRVNGASSYNLSDHSAITLRINN